MIQDAVVSSDNRGCSSSSGLQAICDDKEIPYLWNCSSGPSLWKRPRSYSTIVGVSK